ncbi:hypothetical protein [Marilutibacter alkalisoli]|uniref:Uncharacterized protein n=1 Tax=Marilutibacter alkalisoli TaxID=2591633 RepID=A0A514BQ53_9GAMM|nr:hypothetical protein [Lysobacter alkalisoli]QDH69501.1 hypothetical protein FKV23_04890 [Lysobacter alkalisoli]
MRILLKLLAGILVLAVIAGVGLYWVSRTQGMTPEREAVVELMTSPDDLPGRNAFATFWLLGHDVAEDQVEAVVAEDVARFMGSPWPATEGDAPFVSVAVERFGAASAPSEAESMLCALREPGCLQKVRRAPGEYERLLASMAVPLRQMEALADAGHYRNGFPPRVDAPFPPRLNDALRAPMTAHALAFIQGDIEGGLAGTCRSVAMWRRLVPASDSLVIAMAAIAAADGHSRLFAEMLAELPDRAAVPRECDAAYAPPEPGEASVCMAMKGEFAVMRAAMQDPAMTGSEGVAWYLRWAYDADATVARSAEHLSTGCSEPGQRAILADRPLRGQRRNGFEIECIANFAGCLLTSGVVYDSYLQRAQDHGARLRLMATLLWLHRNARDPRPLATRLASRPAGTRSPTRGLEVVDDGRWLQVAMYDDSRGDHWKVPLPRSVTDR